MVLLMNFLDKLKERTKKLQSRKQRRRVAISWPE